VPITVSLLALVRIVDIRDGCKCNDQSWVVKKYKARNEISEVLKYNKIKTPYWIFIVLIIDFSEKAKDNEESQ
jgi:hypothetical protein